MSVSALDVLMEPVPQLQPAAAAISSSSSSSSSATAAASKSTTSIVAESACLFFHERLHEPKVQLIRTLWEAILAPVLAKNDYDGSGKDNP